MNTNTFTLKCNNVGGQATFHEEFNAWGCVGDNMSPAFSWVHPPAGTKSFALTLFDPDAPTGSGWWHWVCFDIPAHIAELPKGAGNPAMGLMPDGAVQSLNDYKTYGYGGPCPPEGHGIHQYIFTLYALDMETLGLDKEINPAVVGFNINAHVIEKSSVVMYYKR